MKEIASTLDVAVSSVSSWTRDIALDEEQLAALRARNPIHDQQVAGHGGQRERARAGASSGRRRGARGQDRTTRPPERFAFSVNCFLNNGLPLHDIEQHWLAALGLPETCLRAAQVNVVSRASRWKRNTLVYGTGRLCVHSVAIVQSIYGAIQEYGGFARPEWLD